MITISQTLSKPITEYDFLGYDDTHPPELLAQGMFTKAENVFVSEKKIVKVFGSSAIASSISTQKFNGLTPFEIITSGVKYLVANVNGVSNAQLYKWNGSGNFAAIGSANLTNDLPMYFVAAANYLFGVNGTEVVDWDGTTVTKNRANVPIGYYTEWFHNYLFIANNANYPSRLYWSDLGTPLTFTAANYVDINPGDSDYITGLAITQDELLVFKKNTIWAITGWSGTSFSSATISTQNTNSRIFGFGTMSPLSIVEVGNEVYFFSMLGNTPVIRSLYKTINSITLAGGIISEGIRGTLNDVTLSALNKIAGIYDGRYVYWAIPTAGSSINNKIIVLDTQQISKYRFSRNVYPFTTMKGKNAQSFALSTIPGYSNIYFADSSIVVASPVQYSGLVLKFDTSIHSDKGTPIAIDIQTRKFMLDSARKSKWKYLYFKYDSGVASTLNINALVDSSSLFTPQKSKSLISMSPGLGPTGTFTLGASLLGGSVVLSR